MTNDPTTLLKAFLATSTALTIVPALSQIANAQAASRTWQPSEITPSQTVQLHVAQQTGQQNVRRPNSSGPSNTGTGNGAVQKDDATSQTGNSHGSRHPTRIDHTDPTNTEPAASVTASPTSGEHDTIVVTGSHIRGVNTAVGNQVISITQEEIYRAGHSTIRDVFENLPQNVGSGATPEYQPNDENSTNSAMGTTINLRGLGSTATLVLINGRRLPAGGYFTDAVDASIIPIAAIERIEVLPDGASAVYGSDAVAGVVNFILKKDYTGLETRARYGTTPGTNVNEYQVSQTGGLNWSTGNILLAYEFQHRDPLAADEYSYTRTGDFRNQGGRDRRLPYGFPGNIINRQTLQIHFAIPVLQNGTDLMRNHLLPPTAADIDELSVNRDLYPRMSSHRVYLTANQELTNSISLFAEFRLNRREYVNRTGSNLGILPVSSTSPYYIDVYGTGATVHVAYSFEEIGPKKSTGESTSYGVVTGLNFQHPLDWHTEAFASINREDVANRTRNSINFTALTQAVNSRDPESTFNPFDTLTPLLSQNIGRFLRKPAELKLDSAIDQYQLITSGPVFPIGASDVKLAVGIDHRREHFTRKYLDAPIAPGDFRRRVNAVFGELYIPLVDSGMELPAIDRLEISTSLRHERYKDKAALPFRQEKPTQSSTDPRVGILWSPFNGINLRGSYGTSFRTPGLRTLAEVNSVSPGTFADPQSSTGATYGLLFEGATPLTNETAKTWTVGLETAPPQLSGLRFSANYFNIKFTNQIIRPNSFTALSDPSLSGIVIRNPSITQIEAVCSSAPPDRTTGCENPELIRVIIDGRLKNFASSVVSGIDFTANYTFDTKAFGLFSVGINGVYLTNYKFSIFSAGNAESRLDRPGYPLDFRARASATWSPTEQTTVAIFANYADKYYDNLNMRPISSHTVIDLIASHNFKIENRKNLLSGFSVQLSITNLLNNAPPFYENEATRMAYDPVNAEPLGRSFALTITKRW